MTTTTCAQLVKKHPRYAMSLLIPVVAIVVVYFVVKYPHTPVNTTCTTKHASVNLTLETLPIMCKSNYNGSCTYLPLCNEGIVGTCCISKWYPDNFHFNYTCTNIGIATIPYSLSVLINDKVNDYSGKCQVYLGSDWPGDSLDTRMCFQWVTYFGDMTASEYPCWYLRFDASYIRFGTYADEDFYNQVWNITAGSLFALEVIGVILYILHLRRELERSLGVAERPWKDPLILQNQSSEE